MVFRTLIAFLCLTPFCQGGERYYIVLFGSQSCPKIPRYAHTFATVVKATDCSTPGNAPLTEYHTISWLPADLTIDVYRIRPEAGHNYTLVQTLPFVARNQKIAMWGPFEIPKCYYDRFLKYRSEFENNPDIKYKAVSPLFWRYHVTSCIHAVSDTIPNDHRLSHPRVLNGWSSIPLILDALHERGLILRSECDHSWVLGRLPLGDYRIIRKTHCFRYGRRTLSIVLTHWRSYFFSPNSDFRNVWICIPHSEFGATSRALSRVRCEATLSNVD